MVKHKIVEFPDGTFAVRSALPGVLGWEYLDAHLWRGGTWWPKGYLGHAKVSSLQEAKALYERYLKLSGKPVKIHSI